MLVSGDFFWGFSVSLEKNLQSEDICLAASVLGWVERERAECPRVQTETQSTPIFSPCSCHLHPHLCSEGPKSAVSSKAWAGRVPGCREWGEYHWLQPLHVHIPQPPSSKGVTSYIYRSQWLLPCTFPNLLKSYSDVVSAQDFFVASFFIILLSF